METLWLDVACLLLVLLALSMPISWKKFRAGVRVVWTGLSVDVSEGKIRPTDDKLAAARTFLEEVCVGRPTGVKAVVRDVARTGWCARTIDQSASFIQPLHVLAATAQRRQRPMTPSKTQRQAAALLSSLGFAMCHRLILLQYWI